MPALLGPILAQALTLTAQDTSGVRVRRFGDDFFYDADTRPSVELRLDSERTSWSLGYGPTLTLDSIGSDAELIILHAGSASASIRFRHTFLTLSQQGGYGEQNFLAVPIQQEAGITDPNSPPLPTAAPQNQTQQLNQVISYGFSTSTLALTHVLTRRLLLSEFAGYSTSAGFDDLARTVFPLQREVFGGITFGYSLTRSDTLYTLAEARYVVTGPVDALIVSAEERWSKTWTRGVSTEVGAGAAYAESGPREDTRVGSEDRDREVFPVATAALNITRGRPNERHALQFITGLSAEVDRRTGGIDQRFLWAAESEHTRGRATFTVTSSGSQSLDNDTENALTSINVGAEAAYAFTPELSGEVGLSTTWQDFSGAGSTPLFWTAALGLSYAFEPYRF